VRNLLLAQMLGAQALGVVNIRQLDWRQCNVESSVPTLILFPVARRPHIPFMPFHIDSGTALDK